MLARFLTSNRTSVEVCSVLPSDAALGEAADEAVNQPLACSSPADFNVLYDDILVAVGISSRGFDDMLDEADAAMNVLF